MEKHMIQLAASLDPLSRKRREDSLPVEKMGGASSSTE